MVKRPLIFTVDALLRYPMISRIHFIECSGNSQALYQTAPPTLTAGQTHGLVSCSEWTGVPLRLLLEEAGVDRTAQSILAEGADAAAMSRSIPMAKAMDERSSPSTRTASGCGRRTAIPCACSCPGGKAT